MTASRLDIVHAYRHLYRGLLRAVLYSRPARYVARDHLRNAFRNDTTSDFNPVKISRTLEFLESARKNGLAHKVVKNVLRVWGEKESVRSRRSNIAPVSRTAYEHFDRTIAKLNETMNLCIK